LERVGPDLVGALEGFLDPARAVSAEEHGAYATRRALVRLHRPACSARRAALPPVLLGGDDLDAWRLDRRYRARVRRPRPDWNAEADLSGGRLRRAPVRERGARPLRRGALRPAAPQPDPRRGGDRPVRGAGFDGGSRALAQCDARPAGRPPGRLRS